MILCSPSGDSYVVVVVVVVVGIDRLVSCCSDAPDQVPAYVVCAEDSRVCKFDIVGSRLLDVLQRRVKERRAALGEVMTAHLLEKMEIHCSKVARLQGTTTETALRAQRAKHSVAASLHQLGILVPLDAKTRTGYRELPTTGQALADLLQQLQRVSGKSKASSASHQLSDLMTRATIASDECDFGTGLLLGLDVFTAGACIEVRQVMAIVALLEYRERDSCECMCVCVCGYVFA